MYPRGQKMKTKELVYNRNNTGKKLKEDFR